MTWRVRVNQAFSFSLVSVSPRRRCALHYPSNGLRASVVGQVEVDESLYEAGRFSHQGNLPDVDRRRDSALCGVRLGCLLVGCLLAAESRAVGCAAYVFGSGQQRHAEGVKLGCWVALLGQGVRRVLRVMSARVMCVPTGQVIGRVAMIRDRIVSRLMLSVRWTPALNREQASGCYLRFQFSCC